MRGEIVERPRKGSIGGAQSAVGGTLTLQHGGPLPARLRAGGSSTAGAGDEEEIVERPRKGSIGGAQSAVGVA